MTTLHYHITIRAPKARVHQLMLAGASYRVWTSEFASGSYYKGSWDKGAEILFLNPEGFGMNARIAEHRAAEFVSIEMLSEVHDGIPDTQDQWQGASEKYTFTEANGVTTLQVNIRGVPAEWAEYLDTTWPKALAKLKTICESP